VGHRQDLKSRDIDLVTALPNAHQEVIWLDVTMYEVAKYKPGTALASLKQPSMAYQSKISGILIKNRPSPTQPTSKSPGI